MKRIDEEYVVNQIIDYLLTKKEGNWHEEKLNKAELHTHGVDIAIRGGKNNSEHFYIECKGKSYAKSERAQKAINREGWLNALGQIVTRMQVKSNGAYKYGMGLYWQGAQKALERIPKNIAQTLNLHIFSVNDKGEVKQFTPGMFGEKYSDDVFM